MHFWYHYLSDILIYMGIYIISDNSTTKGYLAMPEDIFGYSNWGCVGKNSLVSSEYKPGILPNTLQCRVFCPHDKELSRHWLKNPLDSPGRKGKTP